MGLGHSLDGRGSVGRRTLLASGPEAPLARRSLHDLDFPFLAGGDRSRPAPGLRAAALLSPGKTSRRLARAFPPPRPDGSSASLPRDRAALRGVGRAAAPRPAPFPVARGVLSAASALFD